MGGHGGLNILPQKRWNVYGRENRLKVARDEEKYEEEQKEARAKHEAAEKEFRHRMLLQRARERYGGPDQIGMAQPAASLLPAAAAEPGVFSIEAGEGSIQVDHPALASLQHAGEAAAATATVDTDKGQQKQQQQKQQPEAGSAARREPGKDRSRKRSRRERRSEAGSGGTAAATGAEVVEKPTLADLARQLQSGGASAGSGTATGHAEAGEGARQASQHLALGDKNGSQEVATAGTVAGQSQVGTVAAQQIGDRFTKEKLEHINLFADEERKAKNPEAEAEKRAERKARGNADTQTSDAKFDERFKFGYGLTGKQAAPWYAQHAATLPGSAIERLEAPSHHGAQLDQWRRAGQAALATGNGQQQLQQGQAQAVESGAGQNGAAVPAGTAAPGAVLSLLGAVRVAEGMEATDEGRRDKKRGRKRRRSSRGSGRGSNSESGSPSSDSEAESSRDGKHKRHKKGKRDKDKGRVKSREKRKHSKGSSRSQSGESLIEKLRRERLERESAERQRQQQVVASHAAGQRQGEAEGRRYHSGFGFRRPPLGRR
ncbi:hypothetical protein N2152v2_000077 [Parachlorella kessleri]